MSDIIPTTSGIYTIINNINGKLYIGSTANLRKRKGNHFRALAGGCHVQNAVTKYGLSAFQFCIIELVDDTRVLVQREQFYMDETESYNGANGYNLCPTAGSTLGTQLSDEHKAKLSEVTRGKKHPMWGKQHSDETKTKISKAHRGMKASDETKARMSEAHRGRKLSDEHRLRISEALHGRKRSGETKTKISASNFRRWKEYYAERDALQLLLFE